MGVCTGAELWSSTDPRGIWVHFNNSLKCMTSLFHPLVNTLKVQSVYLHGKLHSLLISQSVHSDMGGMSCLKMFSGAWVHSQLPLPVSSKQVWVTGKRPNHVKISIQESQIQLAVGRLWHRRKSRSFTNWRVGGRLIPGSSCLHV